MLQYKQSEVWIINDITDGLVPAQARIEPENDRLRVRLMKQHITLSVKMEDLLEALQGCGQRDTKEET